MASAQRVLRLSMRSAAFDNTPQALVLTDIHGDVVDANAAFERMSGYAAAEIMGRSLHTLHAGGGDRALRHAVCRSIVDKNAWRGELWVRRKDAEPSLEWVTLCANKDESGQTIGWIASFLNAAQLDQDYERMARLAYQDPLTGLSNRRLLMSRLAQALDRGRGRGHLGAVLFIDLDGFKQVNDAHGHRIGDDLLQAVAARLAGRLRHVDTLARLGGDEFVIVLEDLEAAPDARAVAAEVIRLLQDPFELEGAGTLRIGASVGIALFSNSTERPEMILDQADRALYAAKAAGKGTSRVHGRDD